jgi:replication-associated recombination protein RarA
VTPEFPHLLFSQQEIALLSNEERIAWIRQERWIQYPRAKRILERLADLVDYPPRDRMPSLVIYGATGMGKTRVIQKFLRDNRTHFDKKLGRTRLPVVSIQMPPAPAERDLYEEILLRMGGVFAYSTSVTTLRHRIRALARQLEVRMLIIDEIHSLLAGTFREQRIILNAVRFLANDLRIPLVCLGTEEASQALMTDQQLADRFAAAELPAWENDAAFEQLLLSFESILPLRRPSDFRDPKIHQRILSLTEGVLGRICGLLETASVEAIRSGEERICLSLLKEDLVTESLVSITDRRVRRASGR